jgi:hypothetical protein
MKIVINNTTFDYNIGCRLLKTKNGDVPFKGLEDIWNDIEPMTFKEIAKEIDNIEQRRVAISCLGIDNLVKQIKPKLVDKKTIKKETTWVDVNGNLVNKKFNDTYELYEVAEKDLGIENSWNKDKKVHYVKCKDTSTDREYLIWIDAQEVYKTNDERDSRWYSSGEDYGQKINAIEAIAWTIQTDLKEGDIDKIVRQGDCIMIKKKKGVSSGETRHLTEKEYRTLITAES